MTGQPAIVLAGHRQRTERRGVPALTIGVVTAAPRGRCRLLCADVPNAVPARRRGLTAEAGDAGEVDGGRPILGDEFAAGCEASLGGVPVLTAIGVESVRELLAQRAACRIKPAGYRHQLIDADLLAFARTGDDVELARFDPVLSEPKGVLGD